VRLTSINRPVLVRGVTGATAVVLAAGVGLAVAKPVAGAIYDGKTAQAVPETVMLKVSANGKRVTVVSVPLVVHCGGGGGFGGVGSPKPGAATITKKDTFKVSLTVPKASGGSVGTETVTGTFGTAGREHGTLSSKLTFGCDTTVRYTTHTAVTG
jgi:hypothetical protein